MPVVSCYYYYFSPSVIAVTVITSVISTDCSPPTRKFCSYPVCHVTWKTFFCIRKRPCYFCTQEEQNQMTNMDSSNYQHLSHFQNINNKRNNTTDHTNQRHLVFLLALILYTFFFFLTFHSDRYFPLTCCIVPRFLNRYPSVNTTKYRNTNIRCLVSVVTISRLTCQQSTSFHKLNSASFTPTA